MSEPKPHSFRSTDVSPMEPLGQAMLALNNGHAEALSWLEPDKLEYVLVITNYQGGLPPAGQQPTTQTNPDGTLPDSEQPYITPSPSPRPVTTKKP